MQPTALSYCPVCAGQIIGTLQFQDGVRLIRTCEEHGTFENLLYTNELFYESCVLTATSGHENTEKCIVVEVTERCDVGCATCSACSINSGQDEDKSSLVDGVRAVVRKTGARTLALSGGEPLMRSDIWTISDEIKQFVDRVVLITSGRGFEDDQDILDNIAARREWLELYLQFDSLDSQTLRSMRTPLMTPAVRKERLKLAIETGSIVSAVCVVSDFTKDDEIAHLTEYLLNNGAGGVTFQPLRELGRFPKKRSDRETLRTIDGIQSAALKAVSLPDKLKPFPGQPFDMSVSWLNSLTNDEFFKTRSPGDDFRIATSSYWDATNYFDPLAEGNPAYFYIREDHSSVTMLNRHYFDQTLEEFSNDIFLKASDKIRA